MNVQTFINASDVVSFRTRLIPETGTLLMEMTVMIDGEKEGGGIFEQSIFIRTGARQSFMKALEASVHEAHALLNKAMEGDDSE